VDKAFNSGASKVEKGVGVHFSIGIGNGEDVSVADVVRDPVAGGDAVAVGEGLITAIGLSLVLLLSM